MSHAILSTRGRYTATALHDRTRALHMPALRWWNPGWLCILGAGMLNLLGIVAISTTEPGYAKKQLVFLGIGLGAAAAAVLPRYRWFSRFSYVLMLFVLALLIFVLIPQVPDAIVHPRNGSRRWINFGVMDFQPSELAKIAYVFALATYLRFRSNHRRFFGLLVPLALTFIPMGLILVEPDLGTALLFLPTFFAMVIAAGARLKHVVLIIVVGLASAPIMYPFLESHQKDRIQALIHQLKGDSRYVNDIGYQGDRAMRLVGAGGALGVGEDHARDLIQFNKLPEEHNDMVFAVVSCRWGLLGAVTTWLLFGMLGVGGALTAMMSRDPFGRLAALGITSMLLTQMLINTGMTIGLLPITGITLPFVSYGGSSLLTAWLMIGVLFNIAIRRDRCIMRESFEFSAGEETT
jgi:cell division protein FtsW (lipid II flippase)